MRRRTYPTVRRCWCDVWLPLRRIARWRSFRGKQYLYLADDQATELFILEEGRVRIFKRSSRGRTLTLDIAEPGDVFGARALFPQGRHENHAQALTDGRVYAIPRQELSTFLERNPQMATFIMENLGQRVQEMERRLGDLVFKSVPQRLATVLLDLVGPLSAQDDGPACLPYQYTHQEIAEMVNSHRETVTRVFHRFREDHLLDFDRQRIVLLDITRLREMAHR